MKKIIFISLAFFILSTSLHAEATSISIQSAQKETDICYSIVENFYFDQETNSISGTHTIIYDGIVIPEPTIQYSKNENGIEYRGTLKLTQYRYRNGQTIATYQGTLYAVN